jgi:hypothetical protein
VRRNLADLLERAGAPRRSPQLSAPDLSPWLEGNVLSGVWSFAAAEPGLHVCVVALTHGNEIAGAVALDRLLQAKLRPMAGRLTFIFANLDAFSRFDPADPTASRFLEEDLNRLWDYAVLDGPRRSCELRRARMLRPVLDTADVVLDLHSMLWPADPLFLVGGPSESMALALELGDPPLVVNDPGHEDGRRLIEYGLFGTPRSGRRSVLLEAGWHWEEETVQRMEHVVRRLLGVTGLGPVLAAPPTAPRSARVTKTVTARSGSFVFARPWRGGEVLPHAGTLLAVDGDRKIHTPYENCLLVMPNLMPQPGQTALRLATFT